MRQKCQILLDSKYQASYIGTPQAILPASRGKPGEMTPTGLGTWGLSVPTGRPLHKPPMTEHDRTRSCPAATSSDPILISLEIILRSLKKLVDCHLPWSLGAAIGSVLRIVEGSNTPEKNIANAREFLRRATEEADTLLFLASVAHDLIRGRGETSANGLSASEQHSRAGTGPTSQGRAASAGGQRK